MVENGPRLDGGTGKERWLWPAYDDPRMLNHEVWT